MSRAEYSLGICISDKCVTAGLVKAENPSVSEIVSFQTAGLSKDLIIHKLIESAVSVLCKANLNRYSVSSIGVGVEGSINLEKGSVTCEKIGFFDVAIVNILERHFNRPVVLGIRSQAFAQAEMAVAEPEVYKTAFVLADSSVSAAFAERNNVYGGINLQSANLGHTVIIPDGAECFCGKKGCLTLYSSVSSLQKTLEEIEKNDRNLVGLIKDGKICWNKVNEVIKSNISVKNAVSMSAKYLGIAIANIIELYSFENIVLGGEMVHSCDFFFDSVVSNISSSSHYVIEKSRIGEFADIIGSGIFYKMEDKNVIETEVVISR